MMKTKLTVVAVSCLLVAACGDPAGTDTNNGTQNNANANNTNNSNNTNNTNNASSNATNNGSNNPTNNASNNPTNNVSNNGTNNPTNNANPLNRALAATADFAAGSSNWHDVNLAENTVTDTPFGSGDVAVARGETWAFVLDRNGSQVQVLDFDFADLGVIDVSGVGSTNPFHATDAGGSAYISLYNVGEIAVATPNGADWNQERLDLSALDTDGNPEPGAIATDEGFVLVVLQTLTNFMGVDNSQLLVIDSADNSMDAPIDLGVTNAQAGLRPHADGFAVGVTGDFGTNDGGILSIVRNDAGSYDVGAMLITEDELGGDLLDFVFVDDDTAYAVITLPDFSSQLLRIEGQTVTTVPEVASPGFGGLDASSGWLAVGERELGSEAFMYFDLASDELITQSTTLPPSGIVFLP